MNSSHKIIKTQLIKKKKTKQLNEINSVLAEKAVSGGGRRRGEGEMSACCNAAIKIKTKVMNLLRFERKTTR